jgi:hypothetical protein
MSRGNQSPSTTMAAVVVAREQIELYIPLLIADRFNSLGTVVAK